MLRTWPLALVAVLAGGDAGLDRPIELAGGREFHAPAADLVRPIPVEQMPLQFSGFRGRD